MPADGGFEAYTRKVRVGPMKIGDAVPLLGRSCVSTNESYGFTTAFAFRYLECEQQQSISLVQYGRYRLVNDCASESSVRRMFGRVPNPRLLPTAPQS
jgi:hypothetical protein